MKEYFPKSKPLSGNVKVKLDLSNYASKVHLKKIQICQNIQVLLHPDLPKRLIK